MGEFLYGFNDICGVLGEDAVTDLSSALDTMAKEPELAAITDTLKNAEITVEGDTAELNGKSLRSVRDTFRVGKFTELFDELGVTTDTDDSVTTGYKKSFQSLIPDFDVNDANDFTEEVRAKNTDLDVTGSTGDEIKEKLSDSSQKKTETMIEKIVKSTSENLGKITYYGLWGLGVYVIGDSIYDSLAAYMSSMKGCYFVTKTDGKTKTCKLNPRTCASASKATDSVCNATTNTTLQYNASVLLYAAVKNSTIRQALQMATGFVVTSTSEAQTLLANASDVTKIAAVISTIDLSGVTPCDLYDYTDGCVACDSSAATNSEMFVNSANLGSNANIYCRTSASLLDALADISYGMGLDLFDTLKTSFNSIKYYVLAFVVIVVGLAVLSVFLKFGKSDKSGGGSSKQDQEYEQEKIALLQTALKTE